MTQQSYRWPPVIAAVCCVLAVATGRDGLAQYEIAFSTYAGGKRWEHARDVCTDQAGNVYVVGGTASSDFPTTPGAFDRTFDDTGRRLGDAGPCDAFVMKFSPEGRLVWSTLLGGPNYDRAYAVEVDKWGNVYVAGRAGPGFPVTTDSFQPTFAGSRYNAFYGDQNGFVAKLSPDGRRLLWASYVGVGELCRDLAIDAAGNVYLPMGWNAHSHRVPLPAWMRTALAHAYQPNPAGDIDCGIVKVRADGKAVCWATWIGGSGKETQEAAIRVDCRGRPVILLNTRSDDIPTTLDVTSGERGDEDAYVAMFSADGSRMLWSVRLGGPGDDWALGTHNLAVDRSGNVYVAITAAAGFRAPGLRRIGPCGGATDIAVVRLSDGGSVLGSVLVGGSRSDSVDGITVDPAGNVFVTGATASPDFPTTGGAAQRTPAGGQDALAIVLTPDLQAPRYMTLLGGSSDDRGRSACHGPQGRLYLVGATTSVDWPVKRPFQARFAGTNDPRWANGDCVLVCLRPTVADRKSVIQRD